MNEETRFKLKLSSKYFILLSMYINDCSILGVFIVEILILKAILLFYLNMYNDRNYIITDSKNRKIKFYLLTFNCIMILSHTKKVISF